MSARDQLIELAQHVVKEGESEAVPAWLYHMARRAIDAVQQEQQEQEGLHAPLRCVLCDEEVGVMETATHKCV